MAGAAAIAVCRAVVCQERDKRMTDKTNNALTPVATQPGRLPVNQPGPSPVRVKLRRVNASLAQTYPPDGESKVWWKRLKKAWGSFLKKQPTMFKMPAYDPFSI